LLVYIHTLSIFNPAQLPSNISHPVFLSPLKHNNYIRQQQVFFIKFVAKDPK